MYIVKYGNEYLHDCISSDTLLEDLTLTASENNCGFCDFTIYPNHPLYSKLKERDMHNIVTVWDNDIQLFAGFIYELGKEFHLDGHVKCKGELAYLEETIIRPYATTDYEHRLRAPSTIDGYFEWLIKQHNSQTTGEKMFEIGINEGARMQDYNLIVAENASYPTVFDELRSQLLDPIGGYVRLRYEHGHRYIDYLYEWTDSNTQIMEFGVNLTEYTLTDKSDEIATFCVAKGAKFSETSYPYDDGYRVTTDTTPKPDGKYFIIDKDGNYSAQNNLETFKGGVTYYEHYDSKDQSKDPITLAQASNMRISGDYFKMDDVVYSESAVSKYGWIGTVYENSELTNADELAQKAVAHLRSSISPKRTLEIKAVDMHLINPEMRPVRIGEYVRCRSIPHKLDSYFVCTNIELDLNHPDQSIYTLGVAYDTLTGAQSKRIASLNKSIAQGYDAAAALSDEAKQAADNAASLATQAAEGSVADVVTEYALGDSSDVPPTESDAWDIRYPAYQEGKFIWVRTINIYGDGRTEVSDPFVSNAGTPSDGENATLLTISSSRGLLFKTKDVSTVLSVTVYNGSLSLTNIAQLTGVYGDTAYLQWYEQSSDDDDWVEIEADDERLSSNGFMLTISSASIAASSSYRCELIA